MEVHSLQEYLSIIEELRKNYTYTEPIAPNPIFGQRTYATHFIYRGHSDCQYHLLPGIFRWNDLPNDSTISAYSQLEFNILSDFTSEACRFIKDISVDDVPAWLEIAQHFGVPTRLLDFTENPLVALYFACIGSPSKNACVWIVNEPAYNKKFFLQNHVIYTAQSKQIVSKIVAEEIVYQDFQPHYGNMNYIQYPWIYKPHYREERMHLQESIFMLWGADHRPLTANIGGNEYMSTGAIDNAQAGLICSVSIPATSKEGLLRDLDMCGVNEKFIYPGLDGVGRYINKKYSSDTRQKETGK